MNKLSLKKGINLGGWISQYPAFETRYFDTFITEKDIQQIADWGLDHIRLPVDYPILVDEDNPNPIRESGFRYLDDCLTWCNTHGLNLVLDLHKAPGYSFTTLSKNELFSDPFFQEQFLSLWEILTKRYQGHLEDTLAFELLNEIVLPNSLPWNDLAQRAIHRIRTIDPYRLIILGGNHYNAASELANIHVSPDANLLFTFHFYEPMLVTHQLAPWVPGMVEFNQQIKYPGRVDGLSDFLDRFPQFSSSYQGFVGHRFDKSYLHNLLQPAIDFAVQTGKSLYCGEFGVIDQAPIQTRINWIRDFVELLKEYGFFYAIWSYKEMDFGLVDKDSKVIHPELIRIISDT